MIALAQPASRAQKNVPTALDARIKELFHKASVELQDPAQTNDAHVHGARKCLKKLRALSPLLDALERDRLSSSDRFALRIVARSLGRVRAPAAELATWGEFSSTLDSDAPAIAERLLEQRRAPAAVMGRRLQRCARVLAGLEQRVCRRTAEGVSAEEYDQDAFLKSLRRAYRKGRRAMRRAQAAPTWERLHALRRASKYHRYQLQFLGLFFKKDIKTGRSRLGKLTDELGTHHDLGGIERYLSGESAFLKHPRGRKTLKKLRQRMRVIEDRCLELAGTSFRERPSAFERRVRRYFKGARADHS